MPKTGLVRMAIVILVLSLFITALPALAQDELSETMTSEDGILTFSYPAGWYAENFMLPDLFLLGMSEAFITNYMTTGADLNPAEVMLTIAGPQAASMILKGAPATLEEAFTLLTDRDPAEQAEFGEPEAISLNGHDALIVSTHTPERDGVLIAIDFGGKFVLIGAETLPGDYAPFADTVLAIADSVNYITPEGVITYEGSDLTLEYPATWLASEMPGIGYMVMNNVAPSVHIIPGHVRLTIVTPTGISNLKAFTDETAEEQIVYETAEIARIVIGIWDETPVTLSDEQAFIAGEYEGTMFEYASDETEGTAVFLVVEDSYLVIISQATTGEFADFEAEVAAIIDSIVYQPTP